MIYYNGRNVFFFFISKRYLYLFSSREKHSSKEKLTLEKYDMYPFINSDNKEFYFQTK